MDFEKTVGEEIDKLFDSFGDIDTEGIVTQDNEQNGFQKVSDIKYSEIPEYKNQDKDVVISKDKRIGNFRDQVTIQGESDSQYITFEMDRYYDGIDLSKMTIQIHYERIDGKGDNCSVVNVEMSETKIKFGWIIPEFATEVTGVLKVMPFVFGISPVSKDNLYVLKEMYSEYMVQKGLSISGGLAKPSDDWYVQFLKQMVNYVDQVQQSTDQVQESLEEVKQYRDETKELANRVEGVGEIIDAFEETSSQTMEEIEEIRQEVVLSKNASSQNALLSKSYAEGNTGVREDEATRNSRYFMEQAQRLVESVSSGALIPAGTITFENIPTTPITGYMYNISNSFVTDDRFIEGVGMRYNSGVNVYWTVDGKLDVLAGTPPTKEEIGLGNVPNVSTNNQTPTFVRAETRSNIISGETLSVLFGKISKVIADLSTVAFSGSYNDLSNKPVIPQLPNLATVATSGSYNDLSNKPTNIESANYLKGEYLNLTGKTITYLREYLDEVASKANLTTPIYEVVKVRGEWLSLWNSDDNISNISDGNRYTFHLLATFDNSNAQTWLVSMYSYDSTYIIVKNSSGWSKVKKIALEENVPKTPAEIGAASVGELVGCWKRYEFNSAGWHRVAEIDKGLSSVSSCEITIKRVFANAGAECHKLQLINDSSGAVIKSIYDKSAGKLFTKIRCVKYGENYGNKMYVDVYYNSTYYNYATITIGDNRGSDDGCWKMLEKTIVPETATGETVLAEMEFEANSWLGGVSDVEIYNVPRPETNSIFESFSNWGFRVKRTGNIVCLEINVNGVMNVSNSNEKLLNIPERFRPKPNNVIKNYISQNGTPMLILIETNGDVRLYNNNNKVSNWLCRQYITYIIA